MSYNNVGEVGVASELKELTMDTDKVVVQAEAAQPELAAYAWTVRWCPTVARPRQRWLGGGRNLARVCRVMSRWRQSWRCNELSEQH